MKKVINLGDYKIKDEDLEKYFDSKFIKALQSLSIKDKIGFLQGYNTLVIKTGDKELECTYTFKLTNVSGS